jgi:hypothetical protein
MGRGRLGQPRLPARLEALRDRVLWGPPPVLPVDLSPPAAERVLYCARLVRPAPYLRRTLGLTERSAYRMLLCGARYWSRPSRPSPDWTGSSHQVVQSRGNPVCASSRASCSCHAGCNSTTFMSRFVAAASILKPRVVMRHGS